MSKKSIENIYPLSPQQQGMFFECLYAAEAGIQGAHIEQFTCILRGRLDRQAFEHAWQQTVDRHTALRTAFVWKEQEEPLQVALRQVPIPIEYQDWRSLAATEQQTRLTGYLQTDRKRGFDLATAPLIRVVLFQTEEATHQLVWSFHHILLDGWCLPLILNEVFSRYWALSQGQTPSQKPSRPYRDYISWLKKQDLSAAQQYWQQALYGFTRPTPLGVESSEAGLANAEGPYGYQFAHLPAATTRKLQTLAQQFHVTLNTVVQGAWALLLSRYSGQSDVVLGTTISGRPPDLTGIETMIGLFISTLPLRAEVVPEMHLERWLQNCQTRHLQLQQYGYCSTGQIHQWSEMPGALPLYESLLVFENYPVDASTLPAAHLAIEVSEARALGAQTNHALTFLFTVGSELEVQLVYQRQRLEQATVSRILEHLLGLLAAIVANPDQTLATFLDRIPVDEIPRVAPGPQFKHEASEVPFVAPRTPTEEKLAHIWAEVLGVEQVSINRGFFEIGGYSLLAVEVMSRMRTVFQVDLPLRVLLETPTIADLAIVIAQKQAEQVDSETLEQLLQELEQTLPEAGTLAQTEPLSPERKEVADA